MFDMHCHILPGVDDGASSDSMALRMLQQAVDQGITDVFLTPHCQPDRWQYDPQDLRRRAEALRAMVREQEIPVEIYLGTEIRWCPSVPDWLAEGRCLTMGDTNYVLVEFSVNDSLERIEKALYSLMTAGYCPIIAHVERYESLRRAIRQLENWVEDGVLIQCNASALAGQGGMMTNMFVAKLMKRGLVHLVGTDAHTDHWRKPELQPCIQAMEKKYGPECVQELLVENPRALLRGAL